MSEPGGSDVDLFGKDWDSVEEPVMARPHTISEALKRVPAALRTALEEAGATSPGVIRGLTDGTPSCLSLVAIRATWETAAPTCLSLAAIHAPRRTAVPMRLSFVAIHATRRTAAPACLSFVASQAT